MFGLGKKKKLENDGVADDKPLKKKGKIALCLGGGGMRGFAHIGAIKAFRENGIVFDTVCGVSIGSLMAAFYAQGVTVEEMTAHAAEFRFKKLHNGIPFPSKNPAVIEKLVRGLVGSVNIEDLPIPYFCVAVDVACGRQVIFDRGDLAQAITCSCNLPILFKPYQLGDKRLSDGGLKNNIPAATARMFGADKVVTVDVNPTRGSGTGNTGYFAMIMATLDLAISNSSVEGLINSDIIVAPDMSRFRSVSEEGWKEMIDLGYAAALEQMDKIKKVIEDKNLY